MCAQRDYRCLTLGVRGYFCTLDAGHQGNHEAHGLMDPEKIYASWPRDFGRRNYQPGKWSDLDPKAEDYVPGHCALGQKFRDAHATDKPIVGAHGSNRFRPRDFKAESAARKAAPLWSGCMAYFPNALLAVARLSKKANDKHNPGEPLHWSEEKSNDHADCIARHQLNPEQIDPEFDEVHAVMVAWRALAQLELIERKRNGLSGITKD